MADIDITQEEADALIAMEKHRDDNRQVDFPAPVRYSMLFGYDIQPVPWTNRMEAIAELAA